ncbi:MAG: CPBP family glutamic-type intramembrane protease [Planctomycetota bacterium]
MNEPNSSETPASPLPLSPRGEWFTRYAWVPFLAPLVAYMVAPMLFDLTKPGDHLTAEHYARAQKAYANNLLWLATLRAALLLPILWLVATGLRLPRPRVSWLAIAVGVVGVVLWVGVDMIGIRQWASAQLGEESWVGGFLFPARDATNPYDLYGAGTPTFYWFLATRFIGLVVIVALTEELMLRGWLMRLVDNPEFWRVPFGQVTMRAAGIGIGFEVLIHPEKLAAVVWFSLTTWLMFKTKSFWDCVAAHAVTNLLLGVWVLYSGQWELW